jgi:hypothetical protein
MHCGKTATLVELLSSMDSVEYASCTNTVSLSRLAFAHNSKEDSKCLIVCRQGNVSIKHFLHPKGHLFSTSQLRHRSSLYDSLARAFCFGS